MMKHHLNFILIPWLFKAWGD